MVYVFFKQNFQLPDSQSIQFEAIENIWIKKKQKQKTLVLWILECDSQTYVCEPLWQSKETCMLVSCLFW